jgi:hypothetical protein
MAGNIWKCAPEVRPGRSIFRKGKSQVRPERSPAQIRRDKKESSDRKEPAKDSAHIVTTLRSHTKPNMDLIGTDFGKRSFRYVAPSICLLLHLHQIALRKGRVAVPFRSDRAYIRYQFIVFSTLKRINEPQNFPYGVPGELVRIVGELARVVPFLPIY